MVALPIVGQIGVRDTDNPCEHFDGKPPGLSADCDTDGHYMCNECSHRRTCEGCGQRPMHCECADPVEPVEFVRALASYCLNLRTRWVRGFRAKWVGPRQRERERKAIEAEDRWWREIRGGK